VAKAETAASAVVERSAASPRASSAVACAAVASCRASSSSTSASFSLWEIYKNGVRFAMHEFCARPNSRLRAGLVT